MGATAQTPLYTNSTINLKNGTPVYRLNFLNGTDSIASFDSVGLKMIKPLRFKGWNTAGRPAFALPGMVGYNSDSSALEFFDGTSWQKISIAAGVSTPGLQAVLTSNSTLSTNNTVTIGTNTFAINSNSAVKFNISTGGLVSIGGTNNAGYNFFINGQFGAESGTGAIYFNGATSTIFTAGSANLTLRLIGNSKEFRQIITGTDYTLAPYTDNTLPYRIKDFGGTTRFQVDFATPKVGIFGAFELDLGSDASYDTYYRNSSGDFQRLPNGTTGQILTATTGSAPSWAAPALSIYPWNQAGVDSANTSDATNTTVKTLTIPDASRGIVEVWMDCIGTDDGTKGLTGVKRVRYKKTGGTLTLGTIEDEMAIERDGGLTTATFTITTSSNNIIIQVTGEAATNLKWKPTYRLTNNAIAL